MKTETLITAILKTKLFQLYLPLTLLTYLALPAYFGIQILLKRLSPHKSNTPSYS